MSERQLPFDPHAADFDSSATVLLRQSGLRMPVVGLGGGIFQNGEEAFASALGYAPR